jgi:hypothetical protein
MNSAEKDAAEMTALSTLIETVLREHGRCYPVWSAGRWTFVCGAEVRTTAGETAAHRQHQSGAATLAILAAGYRVPPPEGHR